MTSFLLVVFINATSSVVQSPQNSPPVSDLDADKNPVQVSHFLLDDIFTEVVDSD